MGNSCFRETEELKLIGLNGLERVVIGNGCFTKDDYNTANGIDPNRHFYLKNCERLRELKIGRYSFSDYSVCEIENNVHLEAIEFGELYGDSDTFKFASLKLKSDSKEMS